MPSEPEHPIAIIGGGASAAIVAAHLARLSNPAPVTIFDRDDRFARGIAYSTQRPEHLLNVRAHNMSAIENDPEHFLRWLQDNRHNYGPADFVPRMIYGDYLAEILNTTRNRTSFEIAHVKNIRQTDGLFQLETSTGRANFKHVIVATGNSSPSMPAGAEKLSVSDGYYNNPWQADYVEIRDAKNIIILDNFDFLIPKNLSESPIKR